jgi:hypothetical protein
MSQVQRSLPGAWDQSDVDRVVCTLREAGPMRWSDLLGHPDLAGWRPDRLNDAVVVAWADDLISIDPRDLLVAL